MEDYRKREDILTLELIEVFGIMLADAELKCGTKHTTAFTALSGMREEVKGRLEANKYSDNGS
jgi:hypothetical protein